MPQITLYVDEATEAKLKAAAEATGKSVSRWVADVIRERTATTWPESVRELAGAWTDLPEAEALRGGKDLKREPF